MKNSFTSSFGRKIEFISGHLEFVKKTSGLRTEPAPDWENAALNVAGGHEKLDYVDVNKQFQKTRRELSLIGYASRLTRVCQFLDLLDHTAVKPRFDDCLDLGCGFAVQPRILKALGVVSEAVGIDIYDRSSGIDEDVLVKRHRQLKRKGRLLEHIHNYIGKTPSGSMSGLQKAILRNFPVPRKACKVGGFAPNFDFKKLRFIRQPELDQYVNGDIFEFEGRQFHLITSFSSLEWFEAHSIFLKISELLRPGGIFYLWVPNWWCAVNTTQLAGHFPYACQRLTQEDYFRYLDECLPEFSRACKVGYRYFDPGHPTLTDYLEIGNENGLIPLGWKSNIIPEPISWKYGITSLGYFKYSHDVISDVLEDIHQFRSDVRLLDLLPHTHAIVYEKVDKGQKIDRRFLESRWGRDRGYRPENKNIEAALRKLVKPAKRFFHLK